MFFNALSERDIEILFEKIYTGEISIFNLPVELYELTGETLEKGLSKGFRTKLKKMSTENPAFATAAKMRENTWVFSAAKTFQNIKDIQSKIFDEKGFVRGYYNFRDDADKIFKIYNEAYLPAEYDMAIAQSQMADKWNEFEEQGEDFPMLQYQTAGDGRVRPDHAALDGIIKPVNDPFWDNYFPPNDWGCRCTVIQLDSGRETDLKKEIASGKRKIVENPELFRMNPGKDKIVFDPKQHDYFKVDKRYSVLKEDNFGLPKPEKL